uniref:Uncharacterized protein n=1 Tax=Bursaphelenchus xylophilus TaxID=6326 RepID=A0A1I7RUY0_BURXY
MHLQQDPQGLHLLQIDEQIDRGEHPHHSTHYNGAERVHIRDDAERENASDHHRSHVSVRQREDAPESEKVPRRLVAVDVHAHGPAREMHTATLLPQGLLLQPYDLLSGHANHAGV